MLELLYTLLNTAFEGKVAYNAFPINNAPSMPFICIVELNSDNFGADNQVYFKRKNVNIELYTEYKDPATEQTLEDVLDQAGIFYETTDTYIDDEKCYERIYEVEV